MSLTTEEVQAVRRTWDLVLQDIKGNGVECFMRLFQTHPPYKNLFKEFRDLSNEEVRESSKLRGHATTFMRQVTAFVDSLDDGEALVYMINKVCDNHHPRGVGMEHYKNLYVILAAFLAEALGDAFDATAQSGWTKVIGVLTDVMDTRLSQKAAE